MTRQRCACWAVVLVVLALSTKAALAGLIIENDGSDLCAANLKSCTSRCALPQSFLFMCNSGGTFNKPYSDCKCVTPPPVGAQTDGSAIFQMVQWPGPEACQSNSWLYDCAQWMNVQAMNNNLQGQATDQASAMAAIASMQAAQEAQMAAMQVAQEQMAAGGGQAAMPGQSTAGVPGMDPAAAGVPGMGGTGSTGSAGMGMASGGAGMGGSSGVGGAPMGGAGMGMEGAGMSVGGAGVSVGGAGMQQPTNSLMGNNMMGHRHLLQAGMMAGGMSAAGPTVMPTTSLSAACQKPIQGLVTAAGGGVMVIPNFKGVATMMTRGNDTMFIQLGGQGSNCVAAYKLKSGQIMDMGRPTDAPEAATAQSSAGAAAVSAAASIVLVLATMLLAL